MRALSETWHALPTALKVFIFVGGGILLIQYGTSSAVWG